jgi:hypothetical protein
MVTLGEGLEDAPSSSVVMPMPVSWMLISSEFLTADRVVVR